MNQLKIFNLILIVLLAGCHASNPLSKKQMLKDHLITFSQQDTIESQYATATSEQINTKNFKPMVYVKMNNHSTMNSDIYENYIMHAINKMQFFKKVVTKPPTIYINTEPNEISKTPANEDWFDRVDSQSIHDLRQVYGRTGDFLIAETTLREIVSEQSYFSSLPSWSHDIIFDLKFIDPNTGKTLFYKNSYDSNYNGIDLSIVDSVIHEAKHWLNANKIEQAKVSKLSEQHKSSSE